MNFIDAFDQNHFQKIKDQFLLDPNIVFLNHGSFGATPVSVLQKFRSWQDRLERQPVLFLGREISSLLFESRKALSSYLKTDPQNLVYVPNATYGLNVVARSLDLRKGDEVLTTDHEYGALDRTWRFLSQQDKFEYRVNTVKLPVSNKKDFTDDFLGGISKNTKVLFLSHITSPTALIFPIKEICEKAREIGLITVIDGAHAPGQIDLDLDYLDADFYVGNLHKWLCAPKGSAFLYANPRVQNNIKPLVVSWGWESEKPSNSQFQDYLEWSGTQDFSAYLSVPEAIRFQNEFQWSDVRLRCHNLVIELLSQLNNRFAQQTLMTSDQWYAQMVSIQLPKSVNIDQLKADLYEKYKVEVPIISWNGKTLIRVSIQGYNSISDLEILLEALNKLVH